MARGLALAVASLLRRGPLRRSREPNDQLRRASGRAGPGRQRRRHHAPGHLHGAAVRPPQLPDPADVPEQLQQWTFRGDPSDGPDGFDGSGLTTAQRMLTGVNVHRLEIQNLTFRDGNVTGDGGALDITGESSSGFATPRSTTTRRPARAARFTSPRTRARTIHHRRVRGERFQFGSEAVAAEGNRATTAAPSPSRARAGQQQLGHQRQHVREQHGDRQRRRLRLRDPVRHGRELLAERQRRREQQGRRLGRRRARGRRERLPGRRQRALREQLGRAGPGLPVRGPLRRRPLHSRAGFPISVTTCSGAMRSRPSRTAGSSAAAGSPSSGLDLNVQSEYTRVEGNTLAGPLANTQFESEGGGIFFSSDGGRWQGFLDAVAGNSVGAGGEGGGIYIGAGPAPASLELAETTVAGNRSGGQFAGISGGAQDDLLLWNSIVYNGAPGDIGGFDHFDIQYSDACNDGPFAFAGPGNICADPKLVGGADVHQTTQSPTIDKGSDELYNMVGGERNPEDYEGDPRPTDGDGDGHTVDMGADESPAFVAGPPPPPRMCRSAPTARTTTATARSTARTRAVWRGRPTTTRATRRPATSCSAASARSASCGRTPRAEGRAERVRGHQARRPEGEAVRPLPRQGRQAGSGRQRQAQGRRQLPGARARSAEAGCSRWRATAPRWAARNRWS